jgi:uncharacterized protein YndB with AHSA1/START domain
MKENHVNASMLIRAAPRAVFEAFVEPAMLRKFWLEDASAPLALSATVTWKFMVPGVEAGLTVTAFEPGQRLALRWDDGTDVEMRFEAIGDATRVSVTCGGFDEQTLLAQATGTVEGYAIVLCDLKTLLEQGHSANLVRDKAELIARKRD